MKEAVVGFGIGITMTESVDQSALDR